MVLSPACPLQLYCPGGLFVHVCIYLHACIHAYVCAPACMYTHTHTPTKEHLGSTHKFYLPIALEYNLSISAVLSVQVIPIWCTALEKV